MKKYLLLHLTFLSSLLYAQYQQAPDVWSEPKKIIIVGIGASPSISVTGDTLLFFNGEKGIEMSIKKDSVWQTPFPLSSNINSGLAKNPSFSPDSKEIYFTDYGRTGGFGGWDLWASKWSVSLNNWEMAKNLGANVNSSAIEWTCSTPDNQYLYFVRAGGFLNSDLMVSKWDDKLKQWGSTASFDNHLLNLGHDVDGLIMTGDKKKIYFSMFTFGNYPKHDEFDIYVSYYDSLNNFYGTPMLLNINCHVA